MKSLSEVQPLLFKPDMPEAAKRWDALYHGEIIDRPVTLIWARKNGFENAEGYGTRYKNRVFDDIDTMIDKLLARAEIGYYGGECVPSFCPTLGPDEMAVFCGGEFYWGDDKTDTNWIKPFVTDWEEALPFTLDENHPMWKRLMELYTKCAARMEGKMLLAPIDLHSNMDILLSARGAEQLCYDIADTPELIDKAMKSARSIFPLVWEKIKKAGNMDEMGFYQQIYSHEGAATIQCDFSIMIRPEDFNKWVLPALIEEATLVKHPIYHWDGEGALCHFEAIMQCKEIQCISFIPGLGRGPRGTGDHIEFVDVLQRMQQRGKIVHVWGTPDEIKVMHKELDPVKTIYNTSVPTQDDADALLEWLVKNT